MADHINGTLADVVNIQCSISGTLDLSASIQAPDHIDIDTYDGTCVIIPLADAETVMPTKGKFMPDDVTVKKVPYFETSNESGYTVYIASEV